MFCVPDFKNLRVVSGPSKLSTILMRKVPSRVVSAQAEIGEVSSTVKNEKIINLILLGVSEDELESIRGSIK